MTERADALGPWLTARLGPRLGATGPVRVVGESGPASTGYSAETVIVELAYDGGAGPADAKVVLRVETADPPIYPAQVDGVAVEIDIQRRVMQAVAGAIPVADVLAAEDDPGVIGAPFFVMEFVAGEVPAVDPPYTVAGFFASAAPEQRRALVADGLRVLAALHGLDWRDAGLSWLVPPGAVPSLTRQLDVWQAYGARELGDRVHATLDEAWDVLRRHLPAGSAPAACWGDPRPGNMIWSDFRCVCVTDFEAASISPPELDLGWWLMFDRTCHEVVGAPRLDGEPTREEQAALYEDAARRRVGDTRLHELFAAARYSAIVVRVMNRAVARGHLPAEHTVWLENPAVTALRQLLDG